MKNRLLSCMICHLSSILQRQQPVSLRKNLYYLNEYPVGAVEELPLATKLIETEDPDANVLSQEAFLTVTEEPV